MLKTKTSSAVVSCSSTEGSLASPVGTRNGTNGFANGKVEDTKALNFSINSTTSQNTTMNSSAIFGPLDPERSDIESTREANSSISRKSSASFTRRIGGIFRRKPGRVVINENGADTIPEESSQLVTQNKSVSVSICNVDSQEEEKRRLQQRKKQLLLACKTLDEAAEKLNQTSDFARSQVRAWLLRSGCVLAVPFALAVLPPDNLPSAWLLALFISILVLIVGTEKDLGISVDESLAKLASVKKMLEDLDGTPDAPKEAIAVEDQLSEIKVVEELVDTSVLPSPTSSSQTLTASTLPNENGDFKLWAEENFDIKGFRLNFFADLPQIDFERDFLSKLPDDRQATFLKYEKVFAAAFDPSSVQYKENIPDRFTLLRFLQSDKYDIDKAVARMLRTITWRESTGLDKFLENVDWQFAKRAFMLRPQVFCGYDKHNRPVYVERLGEFFGNDDAWRGLSIKEWIRGYTLYMASVTLAFRHAVSHKGLPPQHRMAFIADLSGLRLMQAMKMIPLLKTLVKEVETHYPEFAGAIILVNCPSFVVRLYALVKKFLDPATSEKIQLANDIGTAKLDEFYGLDVVPAEYGGRNPIKSLACPKVVDAAFNAKYPYQSPA